MYLPTAAAFVALATAPLTLAYSLPRSSPSPANATSVSLISPDQAHANILNYLPAERVISSSDIYSYLLQNYGIANHTIYVQDVGRFIDMAGVTIKHANNTLNKRQGSGTNPCFGYTNYWAEQPQSWWNNWSPASPCTWTGKDPSGATYQLNWSFSLSISENAGVSWDVVENVLSATVGFTVTETWTHGGALTCTIPGKSVGQVWLQNRIGWGWIWEEGCESCEYGGGCGGQFGFAATAAGGAEAPDANSAGGQGVQFGCSTGQKNVQC